ncbi:MAG: aminotransferase class I/II-fold pyridoxal phosphate-dependent enzyme [Oscillospiraceae bacterium]|nr:aminotransferase class I/II-fold pyridoxal phosphate-dependent enzyme [Oscillospiraceae bacterium]
MDTPLFRAVEEYRAKGYARFHMPGHKGAPQGFGPELDAIFPVDLTEVGGVDSLYHADGPILELERRWAALYGAAASVLSAGGSTLCIQTMLALACRPGDTVIAGRGVHTSAVNAMGLLGLTPVWLWPDGSAGAGMGGRIRPQDVEAALKAYPQASAVYLTSPDYFGAMSDGAAIAEITHRYGRRLLVDNAHGAHLKWMGKGLHPMKFGADLCCDSLHKTLPVMTGGAMLQVGDPALAGDAKGRMSFFGSTSPSYPVMLSIDRCLGLLENGYGERLRQVAVPCGEVEALARRRGFACVLGPRDPSKIVLNVGQSGLNAEEYCDRLRRFGIEPEYADASWAVLMAGPDNGPEDYRRVERFLEGLSPVCAEKTQSPVPRPAVAMPLREAMLGDWRAVMVEESCGCTAAGMVCPCPPGIPVVMPGEVIDGAMMNLLKKSGFFTIKVVK